MQLSFLPQILPSRHDYILERLKKNDCYDLRDDKKLDDGDIVGFCRKCGRPVSVADVKCVNAITFTCVKLGPNANGILSVTQDYECWGDGCKRVQGAYKAR